MCLGCLVGAKTGCLSQILGEPERVELHQLLAQNEWGLPGCKDFIGDEEKRGARPVCCCAQGELRQPPACSGVCVVDSALGCPGSGLSALPPSMCVHSATLCPFPVLSQVSTS